MLNHEKFLLPRKSSSNLWNKRRKADKEFFKEQVHPASPHTEGDVVLEDVLNKFVNERAKTFLATARLMSKMKLSDRVRGA